MINVSIVQIPWEFDKMRFIKYPTARNHILKPDCLFLHRYYTVKKVRFFTE